MDYQSQSIPPRARLLAHGSGSVLISQAILSGLAALTTWGLAGAPEAVACVAGGGIAMVNVLLLWRRHPDDSSPSTAPQLIVTRIHVGAVGRFLLTLLVFAAAIGRLRLAPVPLLAGFACAQFGHLAGLRRVLGPANAT